MDDQRFRIILKLLEEILLLIKKESEKQLPFISQKDLLEQLKISPNTLRSWEKNGLKRMEPPIENTRTVFYKISDLIDFFQIK